MIFNPDSIKPLYLQIAEWLETEILNGNLKEEERIYSQYQLAEMFNINPATAAKGLNLLAEANIVYKKRGLGMFVALNAREFILTKHRNRVLGPMIRDLVNEAKRLAVSESELLQLIQEVAREGEGDRK
ncbi:GntR family transcriptional regulator [Desulfitobacterium sp.]|uniref:GntR family transcriptional regulator n=1 Tax=Desulfitobacterium sp. TaxID=49981 RepID=UPI0039C881E1